MLENGQNPDMDCSSGVCIIKGDKSLVERINKKIITEDGRQLLF
jgi:NADH:ubiquinone oxidoreductase subunit E